MSLEEKNKELTVNGPNINKIPCAKCKWAVNGSLQANCMKYAEKPYNVYFKNENCEKFASKKKLSKFSKGEQK